MTAKGLQPGAPAWAPGFRLSSLAVPRVPEIKFLTGHGGLYNLPTVRSKKARWRSRLLLGEIAQNKVISSVRSESYSFLRPETFRSVRIEAQLEKLHVQMCAENIPNGRLKLESYQTINAAWQRSLDALILK